MERLLEKMAELVKVNVELAENDPPIGSGIYLKFSPLEGWVLEYYDECSLAFTAKWVAKTVGDLADALDEFPEGNG